MYISWNTQLNYLKILKFYNLVKLKILNIMFKAYNRTLPINIQNIFSIDVDKYYNTRKMHFVQTNKRAMCVSTAGETVERFKVLN